MRNDNETSGRIPAETKTQETPSLKEEKLQLQLPEGPAIAGSVMQIHHRAAAPSKPTTRPTAEPHPGPDLNP